MSDSPSDNVVTLQPRPRPQPRPLPVARRTERRDVLEALRLRRVRVCFHTDGGDLDGTIDWHDGNAVQLRAGPAAHVIPHGCAFTYVASDLD